MKLSVVIPVFNEEKTVGKLLDRVVSELKKLQMEKLFKSWEVIVVDDGSSDKTSSILKKYSSKKIKVFIQKQNRGKGAALRHGFIESSGDVILTQDADLEYDPKYYADLIKALNGEFSKLEDTKKGSKLSDTLPDGQPKKTSKEKSQQEIQVVYGTRIGHLPLNLETLRTIPLPIHFLSNKFLSWLTSLLYGQQITDMETGYKVFRREVLEAINLQADGFEIEVELTAKTIQAGYKIAEIPITTDPRGYDEGKKIGFWDGVEAIKRLIQYRIESYHFAVIGIITLALITRFWDFTNRYGLWSDQARDVLVGRIANQTLSPPLTGSFSSAGPFTFGPIWYYYAMLADALPGGHLNYWIGMGLLSTLMVLGIIWIARKMIGRFGSLVAGLLAAISLASIESSLASTQHSLVPVMVTGFLIGGILYLRKKRLRWIILLGLCLSSAINAHYQAIYLLPMLALLLMYKRAGIKHLGYLFLAMLLPTIPMLVFDLTHEWWNFREIIDYYRFGQYRIYVPNRWLLYAGKFWPEYWARVVGGGLVFAFSAMVGSGLLFWWNFYKRRLNREFIWLVFGFTIAFVWFRYFRAERTFGYVSFSMPIVILITAWFIDQLRKLDKTLGIAVFSLFIFGSYMQLINNAGHQNPRKSIDYLQQSLTEQVSAATYALYDQGFLTNGCSISLSLVMDDHALADSQGYPIGVCEADVCPPGVDKIATAETGGFSCTLVDLANKEPEFYQNENWVLVSPKEVHRMTVDWWKTEPKLND